MKLPDGILETDSAEIYKVKTKAPGPHGRLPFTSQMLLERPSGDIFGWTQNVAMGWDCSELSRKQVLILTTQGGLRSADGRPIALGYHTGHWEIALLAQAAADELHTLGRIPFAAHCTDPCDGRTQGTAGMFDSLPYRNDAAQVLGRLIRSLPTCSGVVGVATCDKGHPAMMMALAAAGDLPCVLIPGGVTLPPEAGEDAGTIQTLGARYAHGLISLEDAADLGCRACASPGGGCQFLGTAATSQVVGEALGLSLPHTALAPSGQAVWIEAAVRSARALCQLEERGWSVRSLLTEASLRNAMVVHAAFGGSTNLLLHLPAVAHAAGLRRPTVDDWTEVNRQVPRLVSVLPNGPVHHPTVRVFLAGGVPEVMLHLRRLGLLETGALTAAGLSVGQVLDWWEASERRTRFRQILKDRDNVEPEAVIFTPEQARVRGLASTVMFPRGNLAPEGAVIKSTAIDPTVIGQDGVYRLEGPARVFVSEQEAMAALKEGTVRPGDVVVLIGSGPLGAGMQETYQLTSALKNLPFGKHVALVTDARFSGVSTGACIGHVGPEALAGGPIGKLRDGDVIRIVLDLVRLEGRVDLVGHGKEKFSYEEGARRLARRRVRKDLRPDPGLPPDTRLWAAMQQVGGGTWGGCVYDVDRIVALLAGRGRRRQRVESEPAGGPGGTISVP
jgi:putative YjhG/YagF family dehydratase